MIEFYYKARNNHGELTEGSLLASSYKELYASLCNDGLTPIEIKNSKEYTNNNDNADKYSVKLLSTKNINNELSLFCQQMYSLLKSGVVIDEALRSVITSVNNSKVKHSLFDVLSQVQSGRNLSEALAYHKSIYSDFFVGIIRIGEKSGKITDAFAYLADYFRKATAQKYRLRDALRYPLIVSLLVVVAIVVINIVFFPALSKMYKKYGGELPLITASIIQFAEFVSNYWYLIIALSMILFLCCRSFFSLGLIKNKIDKYLYVMPVVGGFYRRLTIDRFCISLAVTQKSGCTITEGLDLVKPLFVNSYFQKIIDGIIFDLQHGVSFISACHKTNFFTDFYLRILSSSKHQDNLIDSLSYISQQYDQQLNYDFNNYVELIRPLLLIIIGIFFTVFIFSVLIPHYNLFYVIINKMNTGL